MLADPGDARDIRLTDVVAEVQPRQRLDAGDGSLKSPVRAHRILFEIDVAHQIRLTDETAARGERAFARAHDHDLPILAWNGDLPVYEIVVAEHRTGEHARFDVLGVRIGKNIVLQARPQRLALVEAPVLRGAVGPMERVIVAFGRDLAIAPRRIEASAQMAAVEEVARLFVVKSCAGLLGVRDAWIVAALGSTC